MSKAPLISVVMSAYNAQDSVEKSVESILKQTLCDFEFIVIDDASKDGTEKILRSFNDPRIQICCNEKNLGLTRSLNKGIALSRGVWIARQDADDVSLPERLQMQVGLVEEHPDIVLVGANSIDIDCKGNGLGEWGQYNNQEIGRILYYKNPFPHSTAFFKKSIFEQVGKYDENFRTSQDFELWMRMAKAGRVSMINQPLLIRKVGGNSITAKKKWNQLYYASRARLRHASNPMKAAWYCLYAAVIAFMPRKIIQLYRLLSS